MVFRTCASLTAQALAVRLLAFDKSVTEQLPNSGLPGWTPPPLAEGEPWPLTGDAVLVANPPTCPMSTRPYRNGTAVLRKPQTLTRGDN